MLAHAQNMMPTLQKLVNILNWRYIFYMLLHYVFIVLQLVNKQIETWSEKICRGIWRRHVYASLLPHLKPFNFDDTNKMTLLDVSHFNLPDIADPQWALVNTPKTVGV